MRLFVRGLIGAGSVAAVGPAAAAVIEKADVGAWKAAVLGEPGAVTQCLAALRLPGADGAAAGAATLFESVSRASGFGFAVQDRDASQEPGRRVEATLALDGQTIAAEGKAVAGNVVAVYPTDPAPVLARLGRAKTIELGIGDRHYRADLPDQSEVARFLDECGRKYGLDLGRFDKGRAEEEKKLGQ